MNNEGQARAVACAIGFFYYNKETLGKPYEKVEMATEAIDSLKITNIEFEDGVVTIHLQRPGLIIGRKGKNIEELLTHIQAAVSFEVKSILVREAPEIPGLYDFSYAEGDFESEY